ncbi:MAG TPA: GntR family transcriptional regulator [Anaerolineaceae bacterium]|nr:GntR family transcriptional regulator [Anaerolineaceae bacterium]
MNLSELSETFARWNKESAEGMQLTQKVTEFLRKIIMDGFLAPESQLPNELDLSTYLDISRSTVRSALATLEQGGFIKRLWGVGTFVAKNPPTYTNLSLNSGVTQLIRSSGAVPGTAEIMITTRPASESVCSLLQLEVEASTIVIERVRLADNRRVVFTVDVLPLKLFEESEKDIALTVLRQFIDDQESIYSFLRQQMNLEIHHGIAWIKPLSAEQYIAEKLQICEGCNILQIEQVDYSNNGEPLALSHEYYVADAFRFHIYRSNQGVYL